METGLLTFSMGKERSYLTQKLMHFKWLAENWLQESSHARIEALGWIYDIEGL